MFLGYSTLGLSKMRCSGVLGRHFGHTKTWLSPYTTNALLFRKIIDRLKTNFDNLITCFLGVFGKEVILPYNLNVQQRCSYLFSFFDPVQKFITEIEKHRSDTIQP